MFVVPIGANFSSENANIFMPYQFDVVKKKSRFRCTNLFIGKQPSKVSNISERIFLSFSYISFSQDIYDKFVYIL